MIDRPAFYLIRLDKREGGAGHLLVSITPGSDEGAREDGLARAEITVKCEDVPGTGHAGKAASQRCGGGFVAQINRNAGCREVDLGHFHRPFRLDVAPGTVYVRRG